MNREGCYRTRWRWLMLAVFVLLALGGCLLSVMQGVAAITPADVLQILWQPSARTADQIIWNITEKLTEHIDGETFCYKRNYQCCKCIYPAKL